MSLADLQIPNSFLIQPSGVRVVESFLYRAVGTNIVGATDSELSTKILCPTGIVVPDSGFYNATNSEYTIPKDGFYTFSAMTTVGLLPVGTAAEYLNLQLILMIVINATGDAVQSPYFSSSSCNNYIVGGGVDTIYVPMFVETSLFIMAGDVVTFYLDTLVQSSNATLTSDQVNYYSDSTWIAGSLQQI